MQTTSRAPRAHGDDGVSLVILAVTLVALLGLGGLAIDGGRAYALRRSMQNAADAAALDATKVLDDFQHGTGAATDVRAAAESRVQRNGGTLTACKLVPFGWVPADGFGSTADCPPAGSPDVSAYKGVYVAANQSQSTFLVQVVGSNSYTADADATAQVGKAAFTGDSPFAVCGAQLSADGDVPLMLKNPATDTYYLNPDAVGRTYTIWGPQLKQVPGASCGIGSKWKGLLTEPGSYTLGGDDWQTNNGTTAGPVRRLLNDPNACGTTVTVGCVLLVPICPYASSLPPQNGSLLLTCTDFGKFQVTNGNANSITSAIFLGAASIATPGGITGPPDANGARRVALTD